MRDFSGLDSIANRGLVKVAGLPQLTTGNGLVDTGLYFIPGVGTAMSAYDTVRSATNAIGDFRKGNWRSGLANTGSALLYGGMTALDAMSFGIGGRVAGGLLKGLGRGAKALGFKGVAKGLGRTAGKAMGADVRVARGIGRTLAGGKGQALAGARAAADVKRPLMSIPFISKPSPAVLKAEQAANAAKFRGGGVGGWFVRHPVLGTMGLGLGTGVTGAFSDQEDQGEQNLEHFSPRIPSYMYNGYYGYGHGPFDGLPRNGRVYRPYGLSSYNTPYLYG
jgi:hypothetical protein